MNKEQNNVHVLQLSAYTTPVIQESKKEDWVEYGINNDYYSYLIERYTGSATNNAVINNIVNLIYGKGLSARDAARKPNDYAQMITLFPKDEVRKMVSDLKMLGGAMIQVIYSKDRKKITNVYHSPVQLWRSAKCDENGDINGYWYSDNWSDTKKFPPKFVSKFGTSTDGLEVMFIRPYAAGMKYYSYPDYQGALPYALLEQEIADYLINEVQNGFSGTKVVNFNNGIPSTEQQEVISRKVLGKLTGSRGQKVVIAFNDNQESRTTVDDIPLNDAPEHYQYLSEECQKKIMVSHNVTSPLLFGLGSANGFSSNADEIRNATVLFENMVIEPKRQMLIDAFETILAFNGVVLDLYFKPLNPLDSEGELTTQNEEEQQTVEMSSQDWIDEYGETPSENWILVDSFDDDGSEEFDFENIKLSQKILNFVKTGQAVPIAKSEQDDVVKGVKYFTRYRYTGKLKDDTRPFCKAMLQADKLYRKEDIEAMSKDPRVNPKWGPEGADTYDIFKFKGGGNCHHVWRREVYATLNTDAISPLSKDAQKIATSTAEKRGYKIRNPYQVSVQPKNLPYNGFLPTNKRFQ